MAIKPIDLQVNINQMHEVGRGEQARTDAVAGQMHVLDEEAKKLADIKKTKLEESKKAERTEVRDVLSDDRERTPERGKKKRKGRHLQAEEQERRLSHDDRLGRKIDILK
jgi:hypothetical protein